MTEPSREPLLALLRSCTREFFQTETSAVRHCTREAERFGNTPCAAPMRAIVEHASGVLREFPSLASRHDLPVSGAGMLVGALFSELRDKVFDHTIRFERSYRGTLLGARHGYDLVQVYTHAARTAGFAQLVTFLHGWSERRAPLLARVEDALNWFALHPEAAMQWTGRLAGRDDSLEAAPH